MRYMVNTKDIQNNRNKIDKKMIAWKYNELELLGLLMPYDDGDNDHRYKLKEYKSYKEYGKELSIAVEYIGKYKPIPEPMRTKLIKEAENIRQQEEYQFKINEEKWQCEMRELENKYK